MKRLVPVVILAVLGGCAPVADIGPRLTGPAPSSLLMRDPEDVVREHLASLEKLKPVSLSAKQRQDVETSIRRGLKDPDTARFGGMVGGIAKSGEITVCGGVNSKNSFGGYVGNTAYIGRLNGSSFALLPFWRGGPDSHETSAMTCAAHGLTVPG